MLMISKMPFFEHSYLASNNHHSVEIKKSNDISLILNQLSPESLLILDIDDTVGRVSQNLGLDPWFRFRIAQFANEGDPQSVALLKTIEIYNQVQLASQSMIGVDEETNIAELIQELKEKDIHVIAITARGYDLTNKTLSLLSTIGVEFSQDVLQDSLFKAQDKSIQIKNGVVFASGLDKGEILKKLIEKDLFVTKLDNYKKFTFVDDSKKNCQAMLTALNELVTCEFDVYHYTYAKDYLPFSKMDAQIAQIQEDYTRDPSK